MPLDILTFGEALVEVMRTGIDQPLDRPGTFTGPYASGAPFIFAVQAARLGAKVAGVGTIGNDAFGRCLIDQLELDGVDTRGVRRSSTHSTGVAFVAYAGDGSRDFLFHIIHAAAGQLSPDMLDPELFNGLRILHLMGSTLSIHEASYQTGLRALDLARAAGAKISFDPNLRPQLLTPEKARARFAPFIEAADVILPTAEEVCLLTGTSSTSEAVAFLLHNHPERIIIVTQGAEGCTVYTEGHTEHISGFAVEEIDPTGAGDCFDAGFLVHWLAGDSPAKAARFANACGALAVTAQGPMAGAQKYAVVSDFLSNHP